MNIKELMINHYYHTTVTIYSNQDKRTYVLLVSHNVPH
jgi:hypothetical protein